MSCPEIAIHKKYPYGKHEEMFACTLFGIDRQVYYRKIKRRIIKQDKAQLVVKMVLEIRKQIPRIGAKKLHYLLGNKNR